MIEKIDHADIVPREILVSKINELIEGYNNLEMEAEQLFKSVWGGGTGKMSRVEFLAAYND